MCTLAVFTRALPGLPLAVFDQTPANPTEAKPEPAKPAGEGIAKVVAEAAAAGDGRFERGDAIGHLVVPNAATLLAEVRTQASPPKGAAVLNEASLRLMASAVLGPRAGLAEHLVLDKPKGLYLSSFRCMSRLAVEGVLLYDGPYPHVDGLLAQVTNRLDTLEVLHLPRASGQSTYTLRRLVRLWLTLALNFSILPLRLSVLLGFLMGLVGLAGAVFVIVEATLERPPEGWASTMVVVLLLSGLQLAMLGILGEYVGRVFLTANHKPQGVVRTVLRALPETRRP